MIICENVLDSPYMNHSAKKTKNKNVINLPICKSTVKTNMYYVNYNYYKLIKTGFTYRCITLFPTNWWESC